jgi:large subunit ribosomal protein L1
MKRGKTYRKLAEAIDKNKDYSVVEAIKVLSSVPFKFDQTIELHFNLGVDPRHSDQVVRGNVVLPHGTGKTVRILVFAKGALAEAAQAAGADYVGAEELGDKILGGWLDFDSVVATPDMMPLVGKLARVLGPRGLMPSPKNGTVTPNVKAVIDELKAGKISYRVDKGANVHAPVGKMSFDVSKLEENIQALIDSVRKNKPQTSKGTYIKSLTLAATMTPGISLDMAYTR